ncbi:unnamed protein product [Didymodactylos carnosus]|uniref:Uncharacterized protein n=1 Tax=Didymodactylos carnosus TaxID=1234261 RepID=A0A814X9W4_9BILA|nr:unnamed protein product [Didymodactylos carnosus]CAF3976816.1 unnamed protein product [Didymodactylos carnosus]
MQSLKYCKLPLYRDYFSDNLKNATTNIEKLIIGVYSPDDIKQLFCHIPKIRSLKIRLYRESLRLHEEPCTVDAASRLNSMVVVQHLTRFTLDMKGHYEPFSEIVAILKYLPQLKQFSFSSIGFYWTTHSILDGDFWENILSTCVPTLEKFSFSIRFRVRYEKPEEVIANMDTILSTFKTNYYYSHKWYFICDYYSEAESVTWFSVYTIPCPFAYVNIQYDTLRSSSTIPLNFSSLGNYDKIDSLVIVTPTTNQIPESRQYPNVYRLGIHRFGMKLRPLPLTLSATFLADLSKLILWSNLTKLSVLENLDPRIIFEILTRSVNVDSLEIEYDIFEKYLLSFPELCSLMNKMLKKLKLVVNDGDFNPDVVEIFCEQFSNIQFFYINIKTINEIYIILPVLLEKLLHLTYLRTYSADIKMFHLNHDILSWLREKTHLAKEWIVSYTDHLYDEYITTLSHLSSIKTFKNKKRSVRWKAIM